MIGVVIPAHDEEAILARCLPSVRELEHDPLLRGEAVRTRVVLDDCSDASESIAAAMGIETVRIGARNVGAARALGAHHLHSEGARWLALTVADTVVSPGWLSAQLALGADAVCGTIAVSDWSGHPPEVGARFLRDYVDACGHPIAWSSTPRVVTSARAIGRAPGRFADAIRRHREELGAALP